VDDGIARGCQEENGGRTAAGAEEILKPYTLNPCSTLTLVSLKDFVI
jgi:hypothetical protein